MGKKMGISRSDREIHKRYGGIASKYIMYMYDNAKMELITIYN